MTHTYLYAITASTTLAWCGLTFANDNLYFSNSYTTQLKYLSHEERLQSFSHQLESEFEYSANQYTLNALIRVFADTEDNVSFPEDALDNFSGASKPLIEDNYGLDLRELYVTFFHDSHTIKFGKQQVAWGETDGIRILDIINPLDYREFLLKDAEDSRIPIWMANYAVQFGSAQLQLLWIPDDTTSHLSVRDYMTTTPISAPAFISQGERDKVSSLQTTNPAHGIEHWDRAANVSFSTRYGDFSLVYINQLHDIPVVDARYIGDEIRAEQFFYRRNVGGLSYSNAFDRWVVRSELAYTDARYVYFEQPSQRSGLDRRKAFDYALALDWSGFDDSTLTLQLSQDIVSGSGRPLTRDKAESTVAVVWDQSFSNQTYQLRFLGLQNLNRHDIMATLDVDWLFRDDLTFGIGMDHFAGDRLGTFGQHKDTNRVRIAVEYTF
jgi:hypothetical protein